MTRRSMIRVFELAGWGIVLAASAVPAAPSGDVDDYLFLARRELRTKGFAITGGDLGVSAPGGLLFVSGPLSAPASRLVADVVRLDRRTTCAALFANEVRRSADGCGPATGFSTPLVVDLAVACGFPSPFPTCGGGQDVEVDTGETLALPPGTYGRVRVKRNATLRLAGVYTLCALETGRRARLAADAPVTLQVAGPFAVGPDTDVGPAPGSGVAPSAVRVFVAGDTVELSHNARTALRLCAPMAEIEIFVGATARGTYVADVIRTERGGGGSVPVTSTTASTTTTTTTTTRAPTTSTRPATTTTSTATTVPKTTTTKPPKGSTTTTRAQSTTTICTGSPTTTKPKPKH